jgi:hypothetical protein
MKPPVALLAEAIDHIEEAQRAVQQSQASLSQTGQDLQQAVELLNQTYAVLTNAERQHLEFLGVPANYVRTWRMRLHKEAKSWKLWLPSLLLVIIAIQFWDLFAPPRQVRLELFGTEIFIGRFFLVLTLMVFLVILHEALHALPLLLLGRNRPGFKLQFGFFGLGAYATGNCLLPSNQFLIVSLTPLIGITLLGGLIWVLIPNWSPWLYLLITINAAGAWGDLWISWKVLRAHPQALGMDTAYEMAIFQPKSS